MASAVWIRGCIMGMCGNEIQHTVLSPDHLRTAHLFVRSCGAMDRDVWWVAIIDADDELGNHAGNVMAFRRSQSARGLAARLEWKSDVLLQVSYPQYSELFRRFDDVEGVLVMYVEQPLAQWNEPDPPWKLRLSPEQSRMR
ncbi:MAG TPA: hypothetical protein VFX59_26460 [Polyangiales bacterium]|nr:hypothetical protein [Polyangiales bacterium]